jgi:hypothetical protein
MQWGEDCVLGYEPAICGYDIAFSPRPSSSYYPTGPLLELCMLSTRWLLAVCWGEGRGVVVLTALLLSSYFLNSLDGPEDHVGRVEDMLTLKV